MKVEEHKGHILGHLSDHYSFKPLIKIFLEICSNKIYFYCGQFGHLTEYLLMSHWLFVLVILKIFSRYLFLHYLDVLFSLSECLM